MEKLIGKANNPMEKEISEFLKSMITPEIEKNIVDKKLTLKGCLEYCFNKGKKYEVKTGKVGFAPITQEQHFKWVAEYFGIKNGAPAAPTATPVNVEHEEKTSDAVVLDFDDLF